MRKFILLLVLFAAGCMTADEPDCEEPKEVTVFDTVRITDTLYLVDRPKEPGETDPPEIVRSAYRSTASGFQYNLIIYFDTVPDAAGYRLYYSASEASGYKSLQSPPYSKDTGSILEPQIAEAKMFCECKRMGGPVFYFRMTAISTTGKESKMSEYKVVVVD